MLTVCRNCKEVFHHEDGKCPYCKTPVPELPHEYEVERAKVLAEKEIAVRKVNKEQGKWGKVLLAGIIAAFLGFILLSTIDDNPEIGFYAVIIGVLAVILSIFGLMGSTIGDEYDKRLEELQAKYIHISPEDEKRIKAFREYQKVRQQPQQTPKVANPSYTVKCPTCGSPNCERVSATSRAVSAAAFGLYSNKRNKQFKCNNCNYEW